MTGSGIGAAGKQGQRAELVVGLALLVLVSSTIALGAWWGFPVQDDTLMVRLYRMGGPELLRAEHVDRPVLGSSIAAFMHFAGEHRSPYIAFGILFWISLAAEAALLWARLFPEWSRAWPAVSLAVVAPVVTLVQFTTLTTVLPCMLPTVFVIAAMLLLLSRSDDGAGIGVRVAAVLLGAFAAVFSEYALATAAAAATMLLLRRHWRGALTILIGVALGYGAYRVISDVTVRGNTDPDVQLEAIVRTPWSIPFRILAAAWECIVGSWGRAAADLNIAWSSKSTLVAALVALAAGIGVVTLRMDRKSVEASDTGARLLALVAAVVAGLTPAFVIRGFPLRRDFETRFFLPVLVFASCATVGGLLSLTRRRFQSLVLFLVVFLCVDRFLLRAVEEKRLQSGLQGFGDAVRPFVGQDAGMVVVVTPARVAISPEETMAKATYTWTFPQAGRLWILRPPIAENLFGPRSGCRSAASLHLDPRAIRWPRLNEPIRLVLWDASHSSEPDLEPYFRGCANP